MSGPGRLLQNNHGWTTANSDRLVFNRSSTCLRRGRHVKWYRCVGSRWDIDHSLVVGLASTHSTHFHCRRMRLRSALLLTLLLYIACTATGDMYKLSTRGRRLSNGSSSKSQSKSKKSMGSKSNGKKSKGSKKRKKSKKSNSKKGTKLSKRSKSKKGPVISPFPPVSPTSTSPPPTRMPVAEPTLSPSSTLPTISPTCLECDDI